MTLGQETVGQRLSESLRAFCHKHGEAEVASWFDGRNGEEVAVSTLSKWMSDPARFDPSNLPIVAEHDPEFARWLSRALLIWSGLYDQALAGLDRETKSKVRRALTSAIERRLPLFEETEP